MLDVVELKFAVSRIDSVMMKERVMGLVFYEMVLKKKSEEVVTDRLLISDEGVRVLDIRE